MLTKSLVSCIYDCITAKSFFCSISGATLSYINLLPDPAKEGSWTDELPNVEIADNMVFTFDGQTTAAEIPIGDLEPHQLGTSFSISVWMKHDREIRDIKEHILCAADGEGNPNSNCCQLLFMLLNC
jgi:hypothetical protein